MCVDPNRVVLPQHRTQIFRDALRQDHRHPRTDSDDLHRRDLTQAGQHLFQVLRAQRQWVAPGNDHVVNLRMLPQIGHRLLQTPLADGRLPRAGDPLARAVPAVRRARGRRDQQRTVRVTMHQPGHRHVVAFLQRVRREKRRVVQLRQLRHAHLKDRVGFIGPPDQGGIVRRDRQRVLPHHRRQIGGVLKGGKTRYQLLDRTNTVSDLPSPVVPGVGAQATGCGDITQGRRFVICDRRRNRLAA